jgi:uncharacterized membrane protein YidH (DUF202 family)
VGAHGDVAHLVRVQHLQVLRSELEPNAATQGLFGTRAYSLYMIGIGLTALILATIQHRISIERLRKSGPVPRSLTLLVAILVAVLGAVSFVLVILRQ